MRNTFRSLHRKSQLTTYLGARSPGRREGLATWRCLSLRTRTWPSAAPMGFSRRMRVWGEKFIMEFFGKKNTSATSFQLPRSVCDRQVGNFEANHNQWSSCWQRCRRNPPPCSGYSNITRDTEKKNIYLQPQRKKQHHHVLSHDFLQAFQFTDEHGEVCPAGWRPG